MYLQLTFVFILWILAYEIGGVNEIRLKLNTPFTSLCILFKLSGYFFSHLFHIHRSHQNHLANKNSTLPIKKKPIQFKRCLNILLWNVDLFFFLQEVGIDCEIWTYEGEEFLRFIFYLSFVNEMTKKKNSRRTRAVVISCDRTSDNSKTTLDDFILSKKKETIDWLT